MSSGFVSGGTNEAPIARDAEWLQAQQAVDEARQREKLEKAGQQGEGKSLYEVLQQNKAAKQEAFEESIKLRHQFQALDEDDAEHLDAVREAARAQDEAVRRETREHLEAFRKQREAADARAGAAAEPERPPGTTANDVASSQQDLQWSVGGKKRRRGQEKELLRGVKLRKASSSEQAAASASDPKAVPKQTVENGGATTQSETNQAKSVPTTASEDPPTPTKAEQATVAPKAASGLGLGAYGSDSD